MWHGGELCLAWLLLISLLLKAGAAANLAQHLKSMPQQQQQQKTSPSQPQRKLHQHEQQQTYDLEKDPENDFNDPYHVLNELKQDEMRLPFWNPYNAGLASQQQVQHVSRPAASLESILPTLAANPKLLPVYGYGPPVLIPYSFFVTPEMLYSPLSNSFGAADDMMGRAANGRRPSAAALPGGGGNNSPIYYVRTLLVPSSPSTFLPFQSLPNFPAYSPILNLPVNFVSNGRTSNIYQIGDSQRDLPNLSHFPSYATSAELRPLPPTLNHSYRPIYQAYNIGIPSQDSKLLSLKRPYYFNGRAEDIYILPNNFNSLYTDSGYV